MIMEQSINQMHTSFVHALTSTNSPLVLSTDYGYVLIVAAVIAFELLIISFVFPGRVRGKVFTQEFLKQHFGQQHKEATGQQIEKGGYPDMGTGLYSQKLAYKDWYDFNNAQRAHYNFLEMAPTTFVLLFIAGLYFPIPAAIIGLALAILRFIYAVGYASGGPKGRLIGALGNDLCLLGLLGLSFASGVKWVKGDSA